PTQPTLFPYTTLFRSESAAVHAFLRTLAGRKVEQTFANETRRSKFREDCLLECLSRHVSSRLRFWAYFYHLMHEEVTEKDAYQRSEEHTSELQSPCNL